MEIVKIGRYPSNLLLFCIIKCYWTWTNLLVSTHGPLKWMANYEWVHCMSGIMHLFTVLQLWTCIISQSFVKIRPFVFLFIYIYRLVSPVLVRTKGVYSDILYFYISTNPTNPTQINNECVLLTRIVCVSTWQIVFLGVIELHCSKTIKNTSMSNTAGDMTHWLNPTYSTLSCSPKYH